MSSCTESKLGRRGRGAILLAAPPWDAAAKATQHTGRVCWQRQAGMLLASPTHALAQQTQGNSRCSRVRMERMGVVCWKRGSIV